MKVSTLVGKVDAVVLTEKETDEIRTIGNQYVSAGDLLIAKEEINHQGFVVDLTAVRYILRVLKNAPSDSNFCDPIEINRVIQYETAEWSVG